MSNFTCKECGATHLDLGAGIGYRTTDDVNLIKINAIMAKNLEIALEALRQYANEDNWCDCTAGFNPKPVDCGCYGCYGFQEAQEALMKMQSVKGLTK